MTGATEQTLAQRLVALRARQERPVIAGAGWLGDALNFITARTPVLIIRAALLIFIAYHAWAYYARGFQMASDVKAIAAEAVRTEAEAEAVNQRLGMTPAQQKLKLAELAQLEAEAVEATAKAAALNQQIDGQTASLANMKAELLKLQADRDKAEANAKAQKGMTERGVTVARAQKQAELAKLNANIARQVGKIRLRMQVILDGNTPTATGERPAPTRSIEEEFSFDRVLGLGRPK